MKVLVTGASGFLGAECVAPLRAAGHHVITVDHRGSPDCRVDLADAEAVRRLPDADTVVHSAAVQYVSRDLPIFARRQYFERNNIAATRHLVDRYTGAATHFVNIGTSMMYEQTGQPVYDVTSRWRAQGPYTASKIEAQRYVERMPNPTSCVIPCIIAGEGRGGLFASLVGLMRRWRVAISPGPGTHKIHLVHVRDAAALVCAVVERRATGRFNAASADPLSIVEWIEEMSSELGAGRVRRVTVPLPAIELVSAASRYRLLAREQVLMLRYPHVLAVDESLALGWTPRYRNAEIVRETARTLMRSNRATGATR